MPRSVVAGRRRLAGLGLGVHSYGITETYGTRDLMAAGGGGLMCPHDDRIGAGVPDDPAGGIAPRLQPGQDLRPHHVA